MISNIGNKKEKELVSNINNELKENEKKLSLQLDIDIELKGENWASNPIFVLVYKIDKSKDKILKFIDYNKNFAY